MALAVRSGASSATCGCAPDRDRTRRRALHRPRFPTGRRCSARRRGRRPRRSMLTPPPVAVVVRMVVVLMVAGLAPAARAAETLVVPSNLRLLVVAPHPDDESLGAGGLIQQTLAAGGRVHVLFMTNGDGSPEAVEMATGHREPSASDYRRFGELRRAEALVSLERYRVLPLSVTFLGF